MIQPADHAQVERAASARSTARCSAFDAADRQLQRRAMLSMWLAMTVMALGLPAHLAAHHAPGWWLTASSWLALALTSPILWMARALLVSVWRELRQARLGQDAAVLWGALAAYSVSLLMLVSSSLSPAHGPPIFFDVAAMALAWLLAGAAQRSDLRRRYLVTLEQLALLDGAWPVLPDEQRPLRSAGWLTALLIGGGLLAAGRALAAGQSPGAALLAGLGALALGCPCTLGIARSSACVAGAARAAAAGWIVASEAAFWPAARADAPAALGLGAATSAAFARIARRVRWAARLNGLWAIGANLLALPLALRGPIDPLLPAAIMLLAWALIVLTNRMIGWQSATAGRS